MSVELRHNTALELNVVEYRGSVTLGELKAVASFLATRPDVLRRDTLNIVAPDADFGTVDFPALDALFARYRQLYAPLSFQLFRRASWVCLSDAARRHIDYWVRGRDMRKTMSSTVSRFDSVAEACEWLLLSDAETAAVERGEGLTDLARFDIPHRALAR